MSLSSELTLRLFQALDVTQQARDDAVSVSSPTKTSLSQF